MKVLSCINRRKSVHPVAFTQFELIVNKWRSDNIHEGERQPIDANSCRKGARLN